MRAVARSRGHHVTWRPRSRGGQAAPTAKGHRIDALDGLRAIAVLAVIAFHVGVPGMSAGFLGVDAFFVLSGYLITGLLLHDVSKYGRVRLGVFWTRRVRRLMPAFLVVVVAVIVWGATLAPPYQRDALRADAISSLAYVANWHFISTTSYFADDGVESPLQHVWSLAVEEQFYVVWPLLVAGAVAVLAMLGRRRGRATRAGSSSDVGLDGARSNSRSPVVVVLAVSAVGAIASAVLLAYLHDPAAPERAYMGTDTRAFEPLLGALLACLMAWPAVRAWCARRAQVAVWLGLAGFVAGVALLGRDGGGASPVYFTGGAVLFSLACTLLVAGAATGDASRGLVRVLGVAPLAALGRISYGVYLWHWPLVVWMLPAEGFSPSAAATVVLLSVLAAALSYRLIETPIREGRVSAWLVPKRLVPVVIVSLVATVTSASALEYSPDPDNRRVLLVGDSVLKRLAPALTEAGSANDMTVVDAALGGCPGTAVTITDAEGELFTEGLDCSDVAATQSTLLAKHQPDVVIWWSRYEMADRLGPDGQHLPAGSETFWAAQRASLQESVDRLTATGAVVVFVRTDRPGVGMFSRCTDDVCHPFLERLLTEDELRVTWNAEVDALAAKDPRVRVVDIEDLYCQDEAVPCDDTMPGGELARPDGSHFSERMMPVVAEELLSRINTALR